MTNAITAQPDKREFRMTQPHAAEHLRAKGYVLKTGPEATVDDDGEVAWMYIWERASDKRKAFLWVFDPAEAYILVRIARDAEGL